MVECRDTHAPVPGDGFAEPAGITHRDFQNVRKLCVRRDTASPELDDGLGRKFAVVEPFHEIRTSLESSAIEPLQPTNKSTAECSAVYHVFSFRSYNNETV
jgi:hypothetical protein